MSRAERCCGRCGAAAAAELDVLAAAPGLGDGRAGDDDARARAPDVAPGQRGPAVAHGLRRRSARRLGRRARVPAFARGRAAAETSRLLWAVHPAPGPSAILRGRADEVAQTLGEGEFGKVKLGLHMQWGEEVAVKLIRRGNIDSSVRMSKVEREIEVLRVRAHITLITFRPHLTGDGRPSNTPTSSACTM